MSDRVDTEALEPMLLSGMRKRPTGDVRHSPVGAGALGTSTKGFLSELDRWLAARDARVRADALAPVIALAEEWAEEWDAEGREEMWNRGYNARADSDIAALRAVLSVGSGVGDGTL